MNFDPMPGWKTIVAAILAGLVGANAVAHVVPQNYQDALLAFAAALGLYGLRAAVARKETPDDQEVLVSRPGKLPVPCVALLAMMLLPVMAVAQPGVHHAVAYRPAGTQVQLFGFQRSCRPQAAPAPQPIVVPQQGTDPALAAMLNQVLNNQQNIIALLQHLQPPIYSPAPTPPAPYVPPPAAANPGPLVYMAPSAPLIMQPAPPAVIGGGAPYQQLSPQGAPYQLLNPQGPPQQLLSPYGAPQQLLAPQGAPQQLLVPQGPVVQPLAPQGQVPQALNPGAPPQQLLVPAPVAPPGVAPPLPAAPLQRLDPAAPTGATKYQIYRSTRTVMVYPR